MTSLDPKRNFTDEERKEIYDRDNGFCQLRIECNGKKVSRKDFHVDHIQAHANGGKTVVSNGQVACPECNLAKGNR